MWTRVIPKSDFSKNVLTVITGTVLAQFILVGFSPILTRMYNPTNYGNYSLYVSIAILISSIATGKYEYAINIAETEEEAKDITTLVIIITTIISILSFLIILPFRAMIAFRLHNQSMTSALLLVPFSVFFISSFFGFNYWYNRNKKYKIIAFSKVWSSMAICCFAVIFNIFHIKNIGLIISYVIGQGVSFAIIGLLYRRDVGSIVQFDRFSHYWNIVKKYKKFPMILAPGTLLNTISSQLYIILISGYFGSAAVGAVALSQTVISLPTSMVSVAFAEVFRQRAIEDLRSNGTCRPILFKTIKKLFIMSIVPFAIIFLFSPTLFAIIFGKQWEVSGHYARILSVPYMFRFIFGPVSSVVVQLSEKLEVDIIWQIAFLAVNFFSVYFGYLYFHNIIPILIIFSLANVALHLISFLFAFLLSVRKKKEPCLGTPA